MPAIPPSKPTRRPRSDGERNRLLLIDAAKRVFAEKGAAASLEQVAREAKVSIASLYRHFPTRDDVISAVYRQEVDAPIEAVDSLAATHDPEAALRAWVRVFVGFLEAKHGMAGAMDTLLFGISSAVAGRTVTRDALESIAGTAKVALQAQAGVDLDEEAINLTRFQQAYQASGRVMQVAADIFDSILAIR